MRNWAVLITESLQMTVHVKAENAIEAVAAVKKSWVNGDYILDSHSLTGVNFSAIEDGTVTTLSRDRKGNESLTGRKLK